MSGPRRAREARPIILTTAAFVVLTALLSIGGRVAGFPGLPSWIPDAPAMKFNAALYFLFIGTAFLFATVIMALVTWAALRLDRGDRARQQQQEALRAGEAASRAAHEELEIKVAERTHDLRVANERLRREVADHALAQRQLLRERDRLQKTSRSLERANADLEAFTYSVSHDLRTPLRAIEGFSAAMLEDCGGQLGPTGKAHLDRIRNATGKMSDLIEGLLTLSRATRAVPESSDVDLSAIAEDVVASLRETSGDRRIDVTIAPELHTVADRRLMRIVLQNLIENAWKFTATMPRARIEVGQLDDGAFFVRDNGVGFDMRYADKLFGAFQRLHSERQFPGTGIGLATVQRIIQKHGGEVRAESTPGLGAAFYFSVGPSASRATAFEDPGSNPDAIRTTG